MAATLAVISTLWYSMRLNDSRDAYNNSAFNAPVTLSHGTTGTTWTATCSDWPQPWRFNHSSVEQWSASMFNPSSMTSL